MKTYFTASVLQKEQYGEFYNQIVSILEKHGHKVTHKHVTETDMSYINTTTTKQNLEYYETVKKSIGSTDLIVAEVSFPSTLNIGHEITLALSKGKPVICLYMKGKVSAFFNGIEDSNLIYREYTKETLKKVLDESLEKLKENVDTRFNFYISPEIGHYLDWVAKTKKLPRAVFLRSLLEKAMKSEKTFV